MLGWWPKISTVIFLDRLSESFIWCFFFYWALKVLIRIFIVPYSLPGAVFCRHLFILILKTMWWEQVLWAPFYTLEIQASEDFSDSNLPEDTGLVKMEMKFGVWVLWVWKMLNRDPFCFSHAPSTYWASQLLGSSLLWPLPLLPFNTPPCGHSATCHVPKQLHFWNLGLFAFFVHNFRYFAFSFPASPSNLLCSYHPVSFVSRPWS